MIIRNALLTSLLALGAAASAASAAPVSCLPCAGVIVDDPAAWAELIAREPLSEDEVLFVKWRPRSPDEAAPAAGSFA